MRSLHKLRLLTLALAAPLLWLCGCESTGFNRDPHGPADVEEYIEGLESAERVGQLQPELVIERLALRPEAWVADLGCGPGVFARPFARACPQGVVFAVDIEPRQLDRLREHLRAEQLANVVPVLASKTSPHLPPGRIDLVFIGDTYHHLEDRVAYMRALRGALRPGGRLALLEYKPGELPVGPPPERKLAAGELESELQAAGWRLEARFDTHPYHSFEVWSPVR
jgi:SAM-dependent methyltransferase